MNWNQFYQNQIIIKAKSESKKPCLNTRNATIGRHVNTESFECQATKRKCK